MSDRPPLVATGSQTVGPFFHVGPGATDRLGRMAAPDVPGEHIQLRVRVLDGDQAPVFDSMVEIWQADAQGIYSHPPATPGVTPPAFAGFGRMGTNEEGWCAFETVRPGVVRDVSGADQAPHVNLCVFARGLLRQVYTRIYFDGDARLEADPILSLVPEDRRGTLLARQSAPGTWEFVVRLQGDDETVFFDL